jgi:hypothetical protein
VPTTIAVATIPPVGQPIDEDQLSRYEGVPLTVMTVPDANDVRNAGHLNPLACVTGMCSQLPCGFRMAVCAFEKPFQGAVYV